MSVPSATTTTDECVKVPVPLTREPNLAFCQRSHIILLVDLSGTDIKSLLSLGRVYCALEDALGKKIDLITLSSLEQESFRASDILFRRNLQKERVTLYAAS